MTVILDWSRLRKRCGDLLSMALQGGKRNRPMQYEVKRRLFRMLWAGNVDAACGYLEGLVRHLRAGESQIACYAVRRELGLRVSSNRVETASDLVVSSQRKHDGMSWSRQGSWTLATIAAPCLNHGLADWRDSGSPLRELYGQYGKVFEDGVPLAA